MDSTGPTLEARRAEDDLASSPSRKEGRVRRRLLRMSVATKLVVMVLIPLLAVLALLVIGIANKVEERQMMSELSEAVDVAATAYAVVAELQRERGRTSVYLTEGSTGSLAALLTQHQATNAADKSYRMAITRLSSPGLRVQTDFGLEALSAIPDLRSRVLSGATDTTEVVAFYSTLIARLQDMSLVLVAASGEDTVLDVSLVLWAAIVDAGEAAGMERAMVAADMTGGSGLPSSTSLVVTMRMRQDSALATFRSALTPETRRQFEAQLEIIDSGEVEELRGRMEEGDPSVTADEWFVVTTRRIDAMAMISQGILADVRARGHAMAYNAGRAAIWFVLIGFLVVAAAVVVAVRVARHIVGRIKALVSVTRAIREGNLDLRADASGSDELAELAEAFNVMTAEMVEVNRSLERQVEERTHHLETAVRSKDELIASISHEVRTPLTAVLGFAELLREQGVGLSDEERRGMIDSIAVEAGDMAEIIEDLLVAARADIGNLRVDRVEFEVRSLVARVVESCRPCPEAANLSGDETWAFGDPGRVRQVVRNLLTNANRYGGERVGVEIAGSDEWVFVRVRDDGPGVAEADAESIFDAYHRATTTTLQPAAVGLGLTVSRSLARLMGGDLTYRREDGHTVFELSLPAAPRSATDSSEGSAS